MKPLACLLLLCALGPPVCASSRTQHHRLDRALEARARTSLAGRGLAGVTVRAVRGRLVVAGDLPGGLSWSSVREALATSGAVSLHVAR